VAEALHAAGSRSGKPLVRVNCSALSESLLESELFGHVRGAFTGADRNKTGRFERANGGTIFLDEIGEITPRMQLRFLRVLETREFDRVGDSTPIKVNVRVIAATNKDLREGVREGVFREDLYYRLKVVEIEMPPLRARRQDVALLMQHFIDKFNVKFSKMVYSVSDQVMDLFMSYGWPGNIRELENVLEHAFVLSRGSTLTQSDLPKDFLRNAGGSVPFGGPERSDQIVPTSRVIPLEELEQRYLEWAVATYKGENNGLAQDLGLSERTFYRKLQKIRDRPLNQIEET
jgi:transcriptional regulator with PAS, ATPase and Fis domain